jgi:alpha-glucosidase
MTLLDRPSHDGSALYVADQAPRLGDVVPVLVRTPAAAGVRGVWARSTPDGEPRFAESTVHRREGTDVWWRAEVEVANPVTGYRFLLHTDAGPRWLNAAGLSTHDVADRTDFRLVSHDPPPAWAADAVVYQIFPDRFARSAAAAGRRVPDWAVPASWDDPVIGRGPDTPYQFYGGDLDGVVDHLDHIEALGVNTIYLTPVFPAPSNHRYNAASFDEVDPLLGGDAALARLADAARARGMRVVGDLTTNHCGQTHPWFQTAAADPASPERELFYFDPHGGYASWLGVPSLPKLNWSSAELRRRFWGYADAVARRWLGAPWSLDGWRVDVANMTGRRGADDSTVDVSRRLREAVGDRLLVAEHAHDASADLDRGGWHGTMNYAGFTRPLWTWLRGSSAPDADFLGVPGPVPSLAGPDAVATMRTFASLVSWRTLVHSWTLLGSHDTARIRTVVGDPDRVAVAAGLLMTLPGVPMVFAGDELGLTGSWGEDARRPMPWHRPDSWDHATLARYQALIRVRRSFPALRHGGLRWAHLSADGLAFLRETPAERLLVLARRSDGPPVRVAGVRARAAENVYGGAAAPCDPDGSVRLPGDGPTLQVWRLL